MPQKPTYEELAQKVRQLQQAEDARLKAESALIKSEEKFRLLYQNVPLPYQSLDEAGCFIQVNQAWLDILGYHREEVIGRSFGDFLHPDWREHFKENFPRFKAIGEVLGIEFEMVKKDGNLILVAFTGKIGTDLEGSFQQTHCIFDDITLRKKTEAALRESESRFRILFEQAGVGVAQIESNTGRFIRINQRYCDIVGFTAPEMIQKDHKQLTHPDDLQKYLDEMQHLLEDKKREFRMEKRYYHKDGSIVWVQLTVSPMWRLGQMPDFHIAVVQDITPRKRAEAALRRIEWMLSKHTKESKPHTPKYGDLTRLNQTRLILDSVGAELLTHIVGDYLDLLETSAAVYEQNGDYALGIFSSGWCQYLDQASRALCQTTDNRKALASGQWHCHESCWTMASKKAMTLDQPTDIPCKGGLNIYAVPIHAGDQIVGSINFGYGDPPTDPAQIAALAQQYSVPAEELTRHARSYESRPPYIIQLAKQRLAVSARLIGEIVERKQAQDALQLSEKQYRVLFKSSSDAVLLVDADTMDIMDANEKAAALYGYSHDEFLTKKAVDLSAEPDKTKKVILEKKETSIPLRYHRKKDGTVFPVEITANYFTLNHRKINISAIRDISDMKKIEKRLNQAQRMEAIGTLAGGIAHDFNNILSSILGFTELSLDEAPKGSIIEDNLQEVYLAGQRAKDLVQQILAFARQSEEELKPIQVDTIAKEVLKLIRASIPTTIEIQQQIESDSLIMGSPTQVHQVLMNLCTNAAQAMEDQGGVLKVLFKDVAIPRNHAITQQGLRPGDHIEIKVMDSGVGMPPDIVESIFNPYFTTKAAGEGTGMGLSVVHGIVEGYQGKITVETEFGKGSRFTIYLPITKKRQLDQHRVSEDLPMGTERILFVDDEAPIAKIGAQILMRLGYSVTTRTSSTEALELFRAKPDAFDLVITDMTMPNMTGDKLAREMMTIRFDMPIILCTGYSKKLSDEQADDMGIKALAYKPIIKADLAKTVRRVLDEANGKTNGE